MPGGDKCKTYYKKGGVVQWQEKRLLRFHKKMRASQAEEMWAGEKL